MSVDQLGIVLQSRRPPNQFLVHGIPNLDWSDFNWRWRLLSGCSGAGNQEETVVVEDIAAIARCTFGPVADPHTNGGLFVGSVTAPVGFPANAARSVFVNPTKAVGSDSLSLREVADRGLVGIGNMD